MSANIVYYLLASCGETNTQTRIHWKSIIYQENTKSIKHRHREYFSFYSSQHWLHTHNKYKSAGQSTGPSAGVVAVSIWALSLERTLLWFGNIFSSVSSLLIIIVASFVVRFFIMLLISFFFFNHFFDDGMVALLDWLERAESALVQLIVLGHFLDLHWLVEAIFLLLIYWFFIDVILIPARVAVILVFFC